MNTKQYLQAVKQRLCIESDYALAKALGLTRGAISKYQNDGAFLGSDTAIKVADILKMPVEIVILDMEKERAKDDTMRAVWQEITRGFWQVAPKANDRRRMPRPV